MGTLIALTSLLTLEDPHRFRKSRDVRVRNIMTGLAQDLRYALRQLRRSPVFTAVTVIPLALSVGGNTAIFSVINAITLRTLPVRDPGRLVLLK